MSEEGSPGDVHQHSPLLGSSPGTGKACPPWVYRHLPAGLRPLLDGLSSSLAEVERWLPLPRRIRRVLPCRSRNRLLLALIAVSLFMMALLSYSTSYSGPLGWLAALGSGNASAGISVCHLACGNQQRKDSSLWSPQQVPMEYACVAVVTPPVPCAPNTSTAPIHSEILTLPPIQFLPNFRNPCWYEDLPTPTTATPSSHSNNTASKAAATAGTEPNQNPVSPVNPVNPDNPYYGHNLFACFAPNIRRLFLEITREFQSPQDSEIPGMTLSGGSAPQAGKEGSRRLRCLPYLYIAGMPKSGSTDLFRKVMHHPDVVRPPSKESHYWSKNRYGLKLNFSSAIPLSDYVDLFDNAALQIKNRMEYPERMIDDEDEEEVEGGGMMREEGVDELYHPAITVDASASTFWNNDEWWRLPENCGLSEPRFTNAHYIHRLTPDARIIVILRNPATRLFSDYLYFTKADKSLAGFHQGVKESVEKLRECLAKHTLRACIYDKQVANGKAKVRLRVGVYHIYLSEWLRVFPAKQVLVLRTEDYARDTRQALRQVFDFLGLRPLRRAEEEEILRLPRANTRRREDRHLGAMWEETRQTLQEFYQPHNQLLARLLRDSRFLWNDVSVDSQRQGFGDSGVRSPGPDSGQGERSADSAGEASQKVARTSPVEKEPEEGGSPYAQNDVVEEGSDDDVRSDASGAVVVVDSKTSDVTGSTSITAQTFPTSSTSTTTQSTQESDYDG